MTLSDLLVALANNQKLYVTLCDKNGNNLITFNAAGYTSVESDLGTREVNQIKIDSPNAVEIILEDETP